jgi:hypothetical protein
MAPIARGVFMDKLMIGLICVTILFALMIVGGTIVSIIAIKAAGDREPAIFGRIGGDGNAARILILFTIVIAVIYLAILNLLDQNTSPILLAIGGGMVGGLEKTKLSASSQDAKATSTS